MYSNQFVHARTFLRHGVFIITHGGGGGGGPLCFLIKDGNIANCGILEYMFRTILEFAQSRDCAAHSQNPEIACQSRDCANVLRNLRTFDFSHVVDS